ncbi:MAG: signal peptidase II [Gammaproteobacteria bacterium]|nr:signal peptidase II [Gammaproteobacteria bacterium]MDH5803080.1 signal peptidase II [Gammaproteobacteria bacterium]
MSSGNSMPMLKWLWLSAVVILLDMVTKAMASEMLELRHPVKILPGFYFTLMHNPGAAFSFLSDESGWQRWFLSVVAIGVSAMIMVWLMRLDKTQSRLALALSLILGGALGNVWDRLSLGYVVDFIDVYLVVFRWPAFNIADSAITIGVIIFAYDTFKVSKAEAAAKAAEQNHSDSEKAE